jgi:hypothetical protein
MHIAHHAHTSIRRKLYGPVRKVKMQWQVGFKSQERCLYNCTDRTELFNHRIFPLTAMVHLTGFGDSCNE